MPENTSASPSPFTYTFGESYARLERKIGSIKGGDAMPIIQVHLFEGRTLDQKRKLVASMTEAVVKSLDIKAEDVRIILEEMARHDYAIAGVLASDKKG